MSLSRLLLVLSALSLLHILAGEPVQAQFVTTKGREFLDPAGKPLFLRGINLGNWLVPEGYMFKFKHASSPRLINNVITELIGPAEARRFWETYRDRYITREDIRFIRQTGLNSVRVPFNFKLFFVEEHPHLKLETGMAMLDRVVGWCREEGLYVIFDMHCAPGGQTGDNIDDSWAYQFLFTSPELQQQTADLWQEIALHFKDDPTVLGYDLLNEPIPHFADTALMNPKLEPLYKMLVKAVRAVDTNHIIFLGGAQWDSNFRVFGEPFDSKLVYTFHKYWSDTTQAVVQEYIDFSRQYNVPIWMGESGENTDQWVSAFRSLLEKNNIGWCFWPYKKMNATSCLATFDMPAGYDSVIAYAEKPRISYEEVRTGRPDGTIVRKALDGLLEYCQAKYMRPNEGYLRALGLTVPEWKR